MLSVYEPVFRLKCYRAEPITTQKKKKRKKKIANSFSTVEQINGATLSPLRDSRTTYTLSSLAIKQNYDQLPLAWNKNPYIYTLEHIRIRSTNAPTHADLASLGHYSRLLCIDVFVRCFSCAAQNHSWPLRENMNCCYLLDSLRIHD